MYALITGALEQRCNDLGAIFKRNISEEKEGNKRKEMKGEKKHELHCQTISLYVREGEMAYT